MTLQASAPLWIQTASKAKRGYVLAGGERYAGHKAPALALKPGTTVDQALGHIFRAGIGHCVANHDAVLDSSDPEGVHQFRVALRRLCSALVIFKAVLSPEDAAWLEREAKRLIDALGPARDWDVFITETLAAVHTARPADRDLKLLAASAEEERRRAYERAETLRAPGYTSFLLKLGHWIETAGWRDGADRAVLDRPLASLAGRLLDKRYKRVLKLGRNFDRLSNGQLHRLRIALKKLRHASEFFGAQFPHRKARPLRQVGAPASGRSRPPERCGRGRRTPEEPPPLASKTAAISPHSRSCRRTGDRLACAHALKETRARIAGDWRGFASTPPFWDIGGAGSKR